MKLLLYGGGLITYRKILKRVLNPYFHQKRLFTPALNHTFKGKTLYSSHNWQHCNACSEAVAGIK